MRVIVSSTPSLTLIVWDLDVLVAVALVTIVALVAVVPACTVIHIQFSAHGVGAITIEVSNTRGE